MPLRRGRTEGLTAMSASPVIHDAEKRQALEQVLQSVTFLRASQVRNFLRYVCEMELAGRGATLHEYLIGVEALGRPTAYSTDEDSTVRRRAYALRHKLDQVYAGELADARIRIDVPKGGYVPMFSRHDAHRAPRHAAAWRRSAGAARRHLEARTSLHMSQVFARPSRRLAPTEEGQNNTAASEAEPNRIVSSRV